MSKTSRYALLAAGAIAILAAVAGVVAMMHADSHVAGSVVARPFDWIALVITLLAITGAGWLLLGQRRSAGADTPNALEHRRCPACAREVFGKWRMCPYCGEMLERTHPSAAMSAEPADR